MTVVATQWVDKKVTAGAWLDDDVVVDRIRVYLGRPDEPVAVATIRAYGHTMDGWKTELAPGTRNPKTLRMTYADVEAMSGDELADRIRHMNWY